MASYLTPDFLLSDINELLRTSSLTQDEFEDRYLSGDINPAFGGRTRYYYDFDFGDAYSGEYYDEGGSAFAADRTLKGARFYSKDDAYEAYLDSLKARDDVTLDSERDSVDNQIFGVQKANIFDPQSLAEGILKARGDEPSSQTGVGLTAFTPKMFKRLRTEYYQPEIEQRRGSLVDRLISKQRMAKSIGTGIAGYGGRSRAQQAVSEQFETGVEDIFSDIQKEKAGALQDIYDVLSQYEAI
tara:strand:- start:645 stop:1370 length:726 start_codon:yes stop_codon:yes gene_type:complete